MVLHNPSRSTAQRLSWRHESVKKIGFTDYAFPNPLFKPIHMITVFLIKKLNGPSSLYQRCQSPILCPWFLAPLFVKAHSLLSLRQAVRYLHSFNDHTSLEISSGNVSCPVTSLGDSSLADPSAPPLITSERVLNTLHLPLGKEIKLARSAQW